MSQTTEPMRSPAAAAPAQAAPEVLTFRRCGALPRADGSVLFRLWAPAAEQVELVLLGDDGSRTSRAMRRADEDHHRYFEHVEPNVPDRQRYLYRLDGGSDRPDPCALWQPEGLPVPSAVVRPGRFAWTDQNWKGVPRSELVIYELHVGTFTSEGTFEAVIPRLAALKELGVTALELMPVNQFPGDRNWGYDGVLPYAAQNTYGGPHGFAKLVDAAHACGLAVILDVVYNHMGPEHGYLREFGPYFTDRYKTPWGDAINYDGPGSDPVRDYVLDNARMWLEEFHLDGLRLDAVHAIFDLGARHILGAMKEVADDVARRTGRAINVIGESDLNDPRILRAVDRGGHALDAQWSDDFHHTVHALLTGERRGYYTDYGEPEHLAKVMETPFLYAWTYSPHRGRKHGAPPDPDLCGDRFVIAIQNHDQVGNRAFGDRFTTLLDRPSKLRLGAGLLLLAPHIPLLFMGEEYGERRPFPFFCSFQSPELVQAVREGRAREFKDFIQPGESIPDPQAVETFESAKLTWAWPTGSQSAGLRQLYCDLLAARKAWPAMRDFATRTARLCGDHESGLVLELVRGREEGDALRAYFNLSDTPAALPAKVDHSRAVLLTSESYRYAGDRTGAAAVTELRPFECIVIGPATWRRF